MEKFYVVNVLESKTYAGEIESGTRALREARNKFLTYRDLDDAIQEYKEQVKRAEGLIGYATRKNSLDHIVLNVFVSVNGAEIIKDYWYGIDFDAGVKTCTPIPVNG